MFRLFFKYLEGYRKYAIRPPILMVLECCIELALPLLMAEILDRAIPAGDVPYICRLGALMVLIALCCLTCGIFSVRWSCIASQGFGANLREALFSHALSFSFGDVDRFSSASLVTRMTNDVNALMMMLSMSIRMVIRTPITIVTSLSMCVVLNARLALVPTTVMVLLAGTIALLMTVCTRLFSVLQTKIDALNRRVEENLVGVRVVKSFVQEEREIEKFGVTNANLCDTSLAVGLRTIAFTPLITIALSVTTAAILSFGGRQVMDGSFLVGDLTAFITYITRILYSVMAMGMALLQMSRAQACAKRVWEVLRAEPSIRDTVNPTQSGRPQQTLPADDTPGSTQAQPHQPHGSTIRDTVNPTQSGRPQETLPADDTPGSIQAQPHQPLGSISHSGSSGLDASASTRLPVPRGAVEYRDVTFRYGEKAGDVLSDITFTVKPGETVGILGGTGAGKSTLLYMLPRFYDVTGGRVLLDGMDVRDYPQEELRRRIGVVLQKNVLFRGTVRENLRWGKEDATEDEMWDALELAGAADFIRLKEEGLDAPVDQGGVNFSGGQKQRLCIARAVLMSPAVLILDDATSAVDSATEAHIREGFRRALPDATILLVGQKVASVYSADWILVIDDGRVAGKGRHEELLLTCPVYREIVASQQKGVAS
ncbi:MAG: ABC transporter ATP-binding protein/permease [Lachnospiraceae bacterium]|jgi:ATP-binding cassette subfamily B protein|nr:ABC transporter ATP-binding protein/permease [Lachnospiraceae bacterium]